MQMKYILVFLPAILAEGETGSGGPSDENHDYYNPPDPWRDVDGDANNDGNTQTFASVTNEDPADFDSDDNINHSEHLSNPRFSIVDNHEDGNELQVDVGGWGHPGDGYHARHGINGDKHAGSQCFTHQNHQGQSNWFADIANEPTISFVKIWPGLWIGSWVKFDTFRVFIDDYECFPIQTYSDAYAIQLKSEQKPMIWSCPQAKTSSTRLRVASTSWISFNEIEIFNSDICPVREHETCTQAEINDEHACGRFTCGKPVPGHTSCYNRQCSCLEDGTTPHTYNVPKCECPEGREGDRCEHYTDDLPCAKEPCKEDGVCRNIFGDDDDDFDIDFRCYCKYGRSGKTCEIPPPCVGASCTGGGDVHYTPFDGVYYDNMGFCQYVITTNGGCSTDDCNNVNNGCNNWPLDVNQFDFTANDPDQDFFMVIGSHDHTGSYSRRVSRLSGLQIYWRPRSNGILYRITAHNDFDGWKWEQHPGGAVPGAGFSYNIPGAAQATNIMNHWNFSGKNVALRIGGNVNTIYIGAGTINGDMSWDSAPSATCNDYLAKITYTKNWYGNIRVDASCSLYRKTCGICGNYDNTVDFDRSGGRVHFERALERKHYWDVSWDPNAMPRGQDQCPYTDQDGNKVPTVGLRDAAPIGRKKRQAMDQDDCPGDYNTIVAECNRAAAGVFTTCGHDPTTLIENCIFDSCLIPEDAASFVCQTLEAFVNQCNSDLDTSNRIERWRTATLCPVTCPANSIFQSCTSAACWPSVTACTVDDAACSTSTDCNEGCYCDMGFIFDGTDCVVDDGTQCQEDQQAAANNAADAALPCGPSPCENGGTCAHVFNNGVPVDYACTCPEFFHGRNCERNLRMSNTAELLSVRMPTDSTVEVGDFLSHGCYCSRLDGLLTYHGPAVSDVDGLCQRLTHCETCTTSVACPSGSGFPFFISMVGDDASCDDNNNNACQQAQCRCSMAAVTALLDTVSSGSTVPYQNCVARTAAAGRSYGCCGAGDKWMMYDQASHMVCELDGSGRPSLRDPTTDRIKEY